MGDTDKQVKCCDRVNSEVFLEYVTLPEETQGDFLEEVTLQLRLKRQTKLGRWEESRKWRACLRKKEQQR